MFVLLDVTSPFTLAVCTASDLCLLGTELSVLSREKSFSVQSRKGQLERLCMKGLKVPLSKGLCLPLRACVCSL